MIDRGHNLSLGRQAELLGLSRSTLYYEPRPVPPAELVIMRRIDELHLDYPFAGSRMLRDLLRGEGVVIGRELVATLMRRMGIEAIYRKPNTSKAALGHKIYPYLLRGLAIERPNQIWAMDITYIPMTRGFVYLAAVVDWFSRRVLSWRLSITMDVDFCLEAVEEALARYGRPEIFNTDQGSQFTSAAFTGLLLENAIAVSMDGRGAWRGRVDDWRGGGRSRGELFSGGFHHAGALSIRTVAPFPLPARQTGHADFPHPAFSRPIRPSLSAGRRVAAERCRGRASRRDTRLGSGGTQRLVVPHGALTSGGLVVPCMLERAHKSV